MGTHAVWQLWVGATADDLTDAPPSTDEMFDRMSDKDENVLIDGLEIKAIYMHGELVGYGVIISELSWQADLGPDNFFSPELVSRAQEAAVKLQQIFERLGLNPQVRLLHHIDLGS
jgi:hypothetical protein